MRLPPLHRTLLLVFAAVLWVALPGSATGKGNGTAGAVKRGPAAAVLAAAALEKGLAALEAKELPTAARFLTEAYRASPRNELLYHFGRLALAEGRVLEAHDFYRRYLADAARDPDETATPAAEQLLSQPAPSGGLVSVQSEPGAFVLVDQRVVGTLPLLLPLLLPLGEHTVSVEFPDKKHEVPVQVAPGRLTELRLSRASGAVVVSVIPSILLYAEPQGLSATDARQLFDATEQAARAEQHTMLAAELAIGQAAELKTCLKEERCQRQLAVKNQSSFVCVQRLKKSGDAKQPDWSFELQLLHVDIEAPAAVASVRCAGCTPEAAAARLKETVSKILAEGLLRPHGTLLVSTEPTPATLQLGTGAKLQTPHRAELWAGSYELRLSLPGHDDEQRTVEVLDGKPLELRVELALTKVAQPVTVTPPPLPAPKTRAPRPKWRLALGGVMLGAGVAMAAAGIAGIAANDTCANATAVPDDTCSRLHATLAPGGFALGSGLLLVGSGALLLGVREPLK